jgi:hypothetical protein
MKTICIKLLTLVWAALMFGCSPNGESPQLVASYPSESQIAAYPFTPPDLIVVYNATITLKVANLDKVVEAVNGLVYKNRGYIASSQSWFQDDGKYTTLVLAVPAVHFDTVHQTLYTFGDLVTEYVSGELRPSEYGTNDWRVFSYITLHLHPKAVIFTNSVLSGWRPAQTLTNAWNIFLSIFGFLVDILIWVTVVAGPFLLVFWLAVKLIQRRKAKTSP